MAIYELRGPSQAFKVDEQGNLAPMQAPCLKQVLLDMGAEVLDCRINIDHAPETVPLSAKYSSLSIG